MSLVISLVGMVGGTVGVYLLRKQKRGVALGLGGSVILLGVILLARTYDLISGTPVWIVTGSVLIIFASFFYIAVRKNPVSK